MAEGGGGWGRPQGHLLEIDFSQKRKQQDCFSGSVLANKEVAGSLKTKWPATPGAGQLGWCGWVLPAGACCLEAAFGPLRAKTSGTRRLEKEAAG